MSDQHLEEGKELEFVPVANASELLDGERLILEIDGEPIAVFRFGDQYFAISDVCSHDDGPVAEGDLDGTEIICPRHGARFDLTSGKALTLPAVVDIPVYPVRVRDGELQIGIPVQG